LRGWLAVSGDGPPPNIDNIVSALRKSTIAPCHQDEQVFDPQRMGSAHVGLRRNRAPGAPSRVPSRAAQYFHRILRQDNIRGEFAIGEGAATHNVSLDSACT
jgi:hypothetical protein